jgi:hypothetical protein
MNTAKGFAFVGPTGQITISPMQQRFPARFHPAFLRLSPLPDRQ